MKIDFVKTLEASAPYIPGRIYFEESTSLIKVATASNQYRVFGGVRSADYDASTDILTILNGNGDEVYIDFSQYVNQDDYEDDQYVISVALNELNDRLEGIMENISFAIDWHTRGYINYVEYNSNDKLIEFYNYDSDTEYYNLIMSIDATDFIKDGMVNDVSIHNGTGANANVSCLVVTFNTDAGKSNIEIPVSRIFDSSSYYDASTSDNRFVHKVTSTDNVVARFDGTDGSIQNSGVTITDSNNIVTPGALYLTSIGSSVNSSTSRLYFGSTSSPYNYITANTSGVFGIYRASDGKGIACYPTENFFSNSNIDLGRSQSLWKNLYMSGTISDGTNTLTRPNKSGTIAVTSDIPSTLDQIADGSTRKLSDYLPLAGGQMNQDASVLFHAFYDDDINTSIEPGLIKVYSNNYNYTNYLDWRGILRLEDNLAMMEYHPGFINYKKPKTGSEVQFQFPQKTGSVYTLATTADIPAAVTDASVAAWGYIKTIADASIAALGYTKNTGTLTGVKFNNTNATVTNGVASITATIPAAPGTLNTNNTTAQTASASEALSGTINLHKVAKTGTYSNLIGAPLSLSTSNVGSTWFPEYSYALGVNGSVGSTCISTSGILKEGFSDWSWIQIRYASGSTTITENLQDYLDKHCIYLDSSIRTGNIPVIKYDTNKGGLYWGIYNNVDMTASPGPTFAWNIPIVLTGTFGALYLGTEGITKEQFNDWSWMQIRYSSGGITITENLDDRLPDAPIGPSQFIQSYLNTTTEKYEWVAVTTLTSNSSDWSWLRCAPASSWTLQDTLNGKQNTLVGSGTGQNIKTVNNNSLVGTGNISVGTLTGVSFNGASASVSNGVAAITATIPTVNNATLTIQKNGTNVNTFTANSSSNVTANIQVNELPTVTASDNGKILRVVNGAWAADTTTTVYSGSNAPNNSTGINGDIYIQT